MKLQLLASTILLSLSTAALADGQFDRSLKVGAQPDLYVSTGSGDIRIHPGSGDQIRIVGHVHAGWSAFGDVEGRIKKIVQSPPITQEGNAIHVGVSNDRDLFNNITIDYEISVPTDVALNLHTGSGDVEIDHVGRYLSAGSGSGNVRAHGSHGPADLATGSGDIELEEEGPGDVKVKSGSGTIRVHGLDGGFSARTGSGDIDADGHISGPATLSSGSGGVHLRLNSDARFNLEASTGSGDIRVGFPNAPQPNEHSRHHLTGPVNGGGAPLQVRTGSGDIRIDGR